MLTRNRRDHVVLNAVVSECNNSYVFTSNKYRDELIRAIQASGRAYLPSGLNDKHIPLPDSLVRHEKMALLLCTLGNRTVEQP